METLKNYHWASMDNVEYLYDDTGKVLGEVFKHYSKNGIYKVFFDIYNLGNYISIETAKTALLNYAKGKQNETINKHINNSDIF